MNKMNWPDDFINKIICGDCLSVTKEMPDECIDMVITSPPYWGLRDYGIGPDQLGLEPTPEFYIEHLTKIFNEAKRVLKKEGTLWLNIGDTYSANRTYQIGQSITVDSIAHQGMKIPDGIQAKCLLMIPERLAWSLIQNGWILRNKNIWHKRNAMPSSVTDRFSNKYEFVYMFSKSQRYYFDLDAVREPHKASSIQRDKQGYRSSPMKGRYKIPWEKRQGTENQEFNNPKGKNPGDVWIITTQPCPFKDVHFATFPEKLCKKAIIPGSPEGGIVLDPFCGVGTALYVAKELKRRYIGIDIKKEYCKLAEKRLAQGVL